MNIRLRVKPESLTQALAHAKRAKNFHDRIGLCWPCANALSWGHQDSVPMAAINPPCAVCAPIVSALPVPTAHPLWRTVRNPLRDAIARPLKTDLPGTTATPGVLAYPCPLATAEGVA